MASSVYAIVRGTVWFGAAVLVLLAAVSVLSIAGRALSGLGLGPIPGDFELVEAGTALAVFCFLPWAHLRHGHAVVDLCWNLYPAPMRRGLTITTDVLLCAAWLLIVWQMAQGMLEYRRNGELTYILQFPVWWGYAASLVPACVGVLACLWRVLESAGAVRSPEALAPGSAHH